jgi:hypothetical protein
MQVRSLGHVLNDLDDAQKFAEEEQARANTAEATLATERAARETAERERDEARVTADKATAYQAAASHLVRETQDERDAANARVRALERMDTAWPLRDLLTALVGGVQHLLSDHDCDRHGYEVLGGALAAARILLAEAFATPDAAGSDAKGGT